MSASTQTSDTANSVGGSGFTGPTTVAEYISTSITQPTPWRSVVQLPAGLRRVIEKHTGRMKASQLHHTFGNLCKELAGRTAENLRLHHPESVQNAEESDSTGGGVVLPPLVYHPSFTLAYVRVLTQNICMCASCGVCAWYVLSMCLVCLVCA